MSRVVITDLVPGASANSSDVNATITSWNNAAGAGDIGPNNVRQEGIDRRTLSFPEQAVQSEGAGAFADTLFASSASSGAVTNPGPYAAVTLGGTDMMLGPHLGTGNPSSDNIVIRASVTFFADNLCLVSCVFQVGPTNAGPWTTQTTTRQQFLALEVVAAQPAPLCVGTYTAGLVISPDNQNTWCRVAYTATPNNVTFSNGVLYVEDYAR
jgi:hypothetical protein